MLAIELEDKELAQKLVEKSLEEGLILFTSYLLKHHSHNSPINNN